jgi:hypothetical protein
MNKENLKGGPPAVPATAINFGYKSFTVRYKTFLYIIFLNGKHIIIDFKLL